MKQERLMQVLIAQHTSEKCHRIGDEGQYTFKVLPSATKREIKKAVELLFKVKVDGIQTVNVKGKRKNFGRIQGKRADWKKAYVKLKEGYDITFGGD